MAWQGKQGWQPSLLPLLVAVLLLTQERLTQKRPHLDLLPQALLMGIWVSAGRHYCCWLRLLLLKHPPVPQESHH